MLFKVTDDSGFLAIIDAGTPTRMSSTRLDVGHDFKSTSARECATTTCPHGWGTGREAFLEHRRFVYSDPGLRLPQSGGQHQRFAGSLAPYPIMKSLTMRRQFPDVTLPEAHERGQVLSVSPGLLRLPHCSVVRPGEWCTFEGAGQFYL